MEPEIEVASDAEEDDDFEDSVDSEAEDEESDDGDLLMQDEEFNETMKIEGVLTGEEWLTSNFLAGTIEATV